MSANKPVSVARRQLIHSGALLPKQTPLMRALRDALASMAAGVKPKLHQPQAVYNAGYPDRSCATDRLAIVIDDVCDALGRDPAKLEQALAIPRTIEAHIRARFAPSPVQSLTEQGLRVSRTDAAEDMTLAEFLVNPNDASVALRAADMAAQEGREKLRFADQVRAFFARATHRGSAA